MTTHALSPETPADTAEIRDLLLAAFETSYEADLVDALRGNPNPNYQGRGVGTALVGEALARAAASAQASNAPTSLLVLGEPAYYSRFGFEAAARHGVRAVIDGIEPAALAEALQLINLTPDYPPISGEVTWPAEYGLDQGDDL